MKLIFMGTPDFAVGTLEALVQAGHEIVLAVTQPDKPQGRKQVLVAPPVKEKALELGLIDGILFDEAVSHQMVASAGHIVPKEKIAEFKALMAKKEASQENPKESMQAIVEQMLDAKLARQEEKLASMMDEKLKNFTPRQDEKKAASPFGKFT